MSSYYVNLISYMFRTISYESSAFDFYDSLCLPLVSCMFRRIVCDSTAFDFQLIYDDFV